MRPHTHTVVLYMRQLEETRRLPLEQLLQHVLEHLLEHIYIFLEKTENPYYSCSSSSNCWEPLAADEDKETCVFNSLIRHHLPRRVQ